MKQESNTKVVKEIAVGKQPDLAINEDIYSGGWFGFRSSRGILVILHLKIGLQRLWLAFLGIGLVDLAHQIVGLLTL